MTISYNSAVFYIGTNNQYDIHVTQVESVYYNEIIGLSKVPNSDGESYKAVKGSEWIRMYDNSLVSYGTIVLIVDEFREEINNDTFTGYPPKWPEVATEVANTWASGNVYITNMTEPLISSTTVSNIFDRSAV